MTQGTEVKNTLTQLQSKVVGLVLTPAQSPQAPTATGGAGLPGRGRGRGCRSPTAIANDLLERSGSSRRAGHQG